MIHVVRSGAAERRKSFGVDFDLLVTGPQSMMTCMHYREGDCIPFHTHPNEQAGYVLFGRIRVRTRETSVELGAGDSYILAAGVEHGLEILEDADEVQVFTPPRADFR